MLADGANKILGKIVFGMNIAANFANPALGFCRLCLRLYGSVIKGVGHTFILGKDFAFLHGTEKNHVGREGNGILNLQGEKCIGLLP